ncbi:hypothetical protein BH10ACI1_BH10ACI1_33720 [soil metagenome]
MSKRDKKINFTEEQIPELATAATDLAYKRALAAGNKVLISENGEIRQVSPDGSYQVIKQNPAYTPVQKGKIIKIK